MSSLVVLSWYFMELFWVPCGCGHDLGSSNVVPLTLTIRVCICSPSGTPVVLVVMAQEGL